MWHTLSTLDKEDKNILSSAYAGYADFLRETTLSEKHADKGGVRELIDKALQLNPDNKEAHQTDLDVKFNYRT
jgi:hypothetical protein